eukprot:528082_1
MVVRLRLQRFGRKNLPFYRVVAADARSKRDGKYIELLGTYNPIPNSDGVKEVQFNSERVRYWLGVGAQPSKRTAWILGQFGILPPLPPRAPGVSHVPKKDRKQ